MKTHTTQGFTVVQLLVAVMVLALSLGTLLPVLASAQPQDAPVAAGQGASLTIASNDCSFAMDSREITLSAGGAIIEQFRIVREQKADAYARVEAIITMSTINPHAVGSRVRMIVQDTFDAVTISYRVERNQPQLHQTAASEAAANKRTQAWPAITRTKGDGVTTLTFRKERP